MLQSIKNGNGSGALHDVAQDTGSDSAAAAGILPHEEFPGRIRDIGVQRDDTNVFRLAFGDFAAEDGVIASDQNNGIRAGLDKGFHRRNGLVCVHAGTGDLPDDHLAAELPDFFGGGLYAGQNLLDKRRIAELQDDADHMRAAGHGERPSADIGGVAHFFGNFLDAGRYFRPDPATVIQGAVNRPAGNAGSFCNFVECDSHR